MHSTHGITINLVVTYITVFFLLTAFPATNAKAIPPRALDVIRDRSVDNEAFALSRRTRLEARNEPHYWSSDVLVLDDRSLVKLGTCLSRLLRGRKTYQCSSQTPSVAECVGQIQSFGQVGSKISVFYTGLGGAAGLTQCKQYFNCNPQLGAVVLWDSIVDNDWFEAQALAIAQGNPNNPSIATEPFQKRMSQAFAEASRGDTYLCTPESNSPNNAFDQRLAWGGWEYPALTRNSGVTRVIRVDPSTSATSQIWTQGDPPTPNAPRG